MANGHWLIGNLVEGWSCRQPEVESSGGSLLPQQFFYFASLDQLGQMSMHSDQNY